jgi:phosphatidylglycerol---prolipoprotein diacylglyceryl transferase
MTLFWNASPDLFTLGEYAVGWYGVLFALAFLVSQRLVIYFYHTEKKQEKDALLLYLIIGVVAGARLGHCLFYNPVYFARHPLEVFEIWKGGLASHGGALGILVATYLFSRRHPEHRFLWLMDRIVIVAAVFSVIVRIGNFFNSEIIGTPTGSPYGVVFARDAEASLKSQIIGLERMELTGRSGSLSSDPGKVPCDVHVWVNAPGLPMSTVQQFVERTLGPLLLHDSLVIRHLDLTEHHPLKFSLLRDAGMFRVDAVGYAIPRHPVQLYEALAYLVLFTLLFRKWRRTWRTMHEGELLAMFFVAAFSIRFILEFVKEDVVPAEAGLPLKIGQLVSLPFIAAGLLLWWRVSAKKGK